MNYQTNLPLSTVTQIDMKFVEQTVYCIRHFTTEDGIEYRSLMNGRDGWERLYGMSWEPVFHNEEQDCREAYKHYMRNQKQVEDPNPYDDFS